MDISSRVKKSISNLKSFMDSSQLAYQGKRFDVRRKEIVSTSGKPASYEVLVHPGAVVLLPIWDENSIVMIRNQREAVGEVLWELPAGTLESQELPQETAARELVEETGYRADHIEPLMVFYPSPGITNELMHAYVAKGLHFEGQQLDDSEVIQPEILSWKKILKMVQSGEICDSKTLTTLLYYWTFCK
jgi:ADP-ribose pyrophosphatase